MATKRRLKLTVGDVVVHEEFGEGTVTRQLPSNPDMFDIRFEEGLKCIKNDSRNIISVNNVLHATLMRRQVEEEIYAASAYRRYDPTVHGLPFSETEYPDLVATLDDWCVQQGTMKIGCNPSYEPQAIQRLTNLGHPELARYLHIGKDKNQNGGEEGHGMWVNIYLPDPLIPNIDIKLHIFLNPFRLRTTNRYYISKLQYTLRLLGKMAMEDPNGEAEDIVLDS